MSIDERKLRADLATYLAGKEPPLVELARATVLSDWEFVIAGTRDSMFIVGNVEGMPDVPVGFEHTTKPLVWVDRDMRWARSTECVYRLGDRKIPIEGADL